MKMAYINVITDRKQWYEQYLRTELNTLDTLDRGQYRTDMNSEDNIFMGKMSFTSILLLIFTLISMLSSDGDCCSIGYD